MILVALMFFKCEAAEASACAPGTAYVSPPGLSGSHDASERRRETQKKRPSIKQITTYVIQIVYKPDGYPLEPRLYEFCVYLTNSQMIPTDAFNVELTQFFH